MKKVSLFLLASAMLCAVVSVALAGAPAIEVPFAAHNLEIVSAEWTGLAEGSRIGQGVDSVVMKNDRYVIEMACGNVPKRLGANCQLSVRDHVSSVGLCLLYQDFYQTGTEVFLGNPLEFIQAKLEEEPLEDDEITWAVGYRYTSKVGDLVRELRLESLADTTSLTLLQGSRAPRKFYPYGLIDGTRAFRPVPCSELK
jgi:hypothetical protein